MELSQSKIITIPSSFSGTQRKLIGEDIVDFIKSRTQSGLDINNSFFTGYSKNYEKSGLVDLTVSEQMLNNLSMLSHGPGFIKIGFNSGDANDKASWIQNPRGQKTGSPARKFMGIAQADLNRILARYR